MNDEFESRYGDTMRRVKSHHSVPVTLERVEAAIRNRGLKFFGCHDHAAAAGEYLFGVIYPRHGLGMPRDVWAGFNTFLKEVCEEAAG